jgi:hypothetical protein
MRNYSAVDLLRFARFSKENEGFTPIDKLKAYNKMYPELSAKERWENVKKWLGVDLSEAIENQVRNDRKTATRLH